MKIDLDKVISVTETAITIRGSRRRITVPSEIVENLDLQDEENSAGLFLKII